MASVDDKIDDIDEKPDSEKRTTRSKARRGRSKAAVSTRTTRSSVNKSSAESEEDAETNEENRIGDSDMDNTSKDKKPDESNRDVPDVEKRTVSNDKANGVPNEVSDENMKEMESSSSSLNEDKEGKSESKCKETAKKEANEQCEEGVEKAAGEEVKKERESNVSNHKDEEVMDTEEIKQDNNEVDEKVSEGDEKMEVDSDHVENKADESKGNQKENSAERLKFDKEEKREGKVLEDEGTESEERNSKPKEGKGSVKGKEPLEIEEVSDEELPESATAEGDLPETEAVSEDELPPEKSDKKKRKKVAPSPIKSVVIPVEPPSQDSKIKPKPEEKKSKDKGTYDPGSPTSEHGNDESAPSKRKSVVSVVTKPPPKVKKPLPELEKYWKTVKDDPSDFAGWTYLLQYVDQENDVEAARDAYNAFLSHYPYCYGYWRKYADYEKRKNNKEKCEEVFERGLKAIPLSVDLWIHYLNYCKATISDDEERLRNQFEKAIQACGMEFRSDKLWDSYIKWEIEGKRLQNVTAIYDRLLATPTQGSTSHFDNFQDHIKNNPPQKTLMLDEFLSLRQEIVKELKKTTNDDEPVPGDEVEAPPGEEPEEQPKMSNDEETKALREKIVSLRRKIHKVTTTQVTERWNFEEGIKRPYFHVKPLERCQLKNWRDYLDFEIQKGDHKRIVILFERCLIACALYEEYWFKYIHYLETIDEKDMTIDIRDTFQRACTIHHTKKPNLHLAWALFEEKQKNFDKAAEILSTLEKVVPNMLQTAYRRINLERRRKDLDKVCSLYEHYINSSKSKLISNNMSIKYARFCLLIKRDKEKAISILSKAVEKDKDNPRLYLQLIEMHLLSSSIDESAVVSVFDQLIEHDCEPEQRVMFAQRKVEFLEDFGSSVTSVQKAYEDLQKYFKIAKEKKKRAVEAESKQTEEPPPKKAKAGSDSQVTSHHPSSHTSHTSAGSSSSGYSQSSYSQKNSYSQGNYQGGQYNSQQQGSYSQQYNQQYNQSDPNYQNYQNWGYSQTGYSGYNQGWGNYNYY